MEQWKAHLLTNHPPVVSPQEWETGAASTGGAQANEHDLLGDYD